jgi:hypothetical protein
MRAENAMTCTRDDIVLRLNMKPFRPFKLRLKNGRILNRRGSADLRVGWSGSLVFDSGRNDYGAADLRRIATLETRRAKKSVH